ncbi:DUF971 domain-containing protein [Pseudomonas sp. PSKL.D1]|uniref:DUF971 domain-containing protein n=1 Tax=Pseudomonas sp. PSKL.D1 TaxID=3029060 RepID=UPI002381743E|nr:gamma-butyrobetaine hydroxylase-like domain-containing protein [Pseudomonas sp. PSKL.D1]WDY57828.1 gamma-butyrobetaine hydroxylase-like domain-containing protein [Pseudomonas sp. PSKL.D1]
MTAPVALHNERDRGELKVQWPEGLQQLSHTRLRGACPCSQCRAALLKGAIGVVVDGVRVERIVVQGYGVQLVFSDGHDRGIYPWGYLRGLS